MTKHIFTRANLYIFLWLVIMLNESMSLVPDTVSVLILFVLFAWSLFLVYFVNNEYSAVPYVKGLNMILLMFSIYGLLRVVSNETITMWLGNNRIIGSREYIIGHWSSLLPIYGFLFYASKGQINKKTIVCWTLVFFIAAYINYRFEEINRLNSLVVGSMQDGVTNNQGYKFLALLPLLVFFKDKPLLQYFGVAYVFLFVFMGMKRGAIFVGVVCLFIFFVNSIRTAKNKTLLVVLSIIVIIAAFLLFEWLLNTNDYFISRLDDTLSGDTDGRDYLFYSLLHYYSNETNFWQAIFGLGADGTFKAVGQAAHNDWIEILIDCGLLGVLVYLLYWKKTYKTMKLIKKKDDLAYLCMLLFVVTQFMKTFFSMSINDIPIYSSLALSYSLYLLKNGVTKNV